MNISSARSARSTRTLLAHGMAHGEQHHEWLVPEDLEDEARPRDGRPKKADRDAPVERSVDLEGE